MKRTLLFIYLLFFLFSCKKDINNLGDSLIGDYFRANSYISNIGFSVVEIENYRDSLLTNVGNNYMFLGEYNYSDFGNLKSSVVAELSHPEITVFGDEVVDSVILKLYFTKSTDSIKYYSNNKIMSIGNLMVNNRVDIQIHSINEQVPDSIYGFGANKFTPTHLEKLANITNYKLNLDDIYTVVQSNDEDGNVKLDTTSVESAHMHFLLDKGFWQDILRKSSNKLLDNSLFKEYVKGVKLDFLNNPSLFYFKPDEFEITVYYHNIRGTKKNYIISLNQSKTGNLFDLSESPNFTASKNISYTGSDLYLFGLNTSFIKMNLFGNDDLKALKDSMWLINKAEIIIEPKSSDLLFPSNFTVVEKKNESYFYILDFINSSHYNPKGYLENKKYTINVTGHVNDIINNEKENTDLFISINNPSQSPLGIVFNRNSVTLKIYYSKKK